MLDLILSHENIWSDNIQVNKRKLQATCTTHIMLYALVAQFLTFLFDFFWVQILLEFSLWNDKKRCIYSQGYQKFSYELKLNETILTIVASFSLCLKV